jgi:hypothetical protein
MPGMPHFVILPAAAGAGFMRMAHEEGRQPAAAAGRRAEPVDLSKIGWEEVTDNMQVMLDIGYGLVPLVDERRGGPLMGRITGVRRQLSKELGFVVPQVRVRDDINLAPFTYRIIIGGVVVGEDASRPTRCSRSIPARRSASCTASRSRIRPSGWTRCGFRVRCRCRDRFGLSRRRSGHGGRDASQPDIDPERRRPARPDEVQALLDGLKERAASRRVALPKPVPLTTLTHGAARAAGGEYPAQGIPPHRRRDRQCRAEDARSRGDPRADPARSGRADHPEDVRRARAAAGDDAGRRAGSPARSGSPFRSVRATRSSPSSAAASPMRCSAPPGRWLRRPSRSSWSSSLRSASRSASWSRPCSPIPR